MELSTPPLTKTMLEFFCSRPNVVKSFFSNYFFNVPFAQDSDGFSPDALSVDVASI